MRLIVKDGNKSNGANGAAAIREANGRTMSGIRVPNGATRPLLATALRAIDGAAEEMKESVLQILNGVMPYVPRIWVRETTESIIVSGRLPDVDETCVEVAFVGQALKIKGTTSKVRESTRRSYRSVERVYRTFERTIPIPRDVDRGKVVATFGSEVLRVHMPRKATTSVPSRSASITPESAAVA